MKRSLLSRLLSVIILTPSVSVFLSACSSVLPEPNPYSPEECNSRAYVHTGLQEHISSRFHSRAPVRMAIIPFSVPANLAQQGPDLPGLGNQLAWNIQAEFVRSNELPIVEVFNRQDWPGKKEEFYTGNFGALAMAREAGYDLVTVGMVSPMKDLNSMSAATKIIEVESGITVWYGETSVFSPRDDYNKMLSGWWFLSPQKRVPSRLSSAPIIESLSRCVVDTILNDDQVI